MKICRVLLTSLAVVAAVTVEPQGTAAATNVSAETSLCVWVPDGRAGDTAVVNITNTGATGNGFGSLRSSNATPEVFARPAADRYSSVNFAANAPANPNLALVTIGPDKKFCYDGAVSDHEVILDLVATISAERIRGFTPRRLIDTRDTRPVAAGSSVCVEVEEADPGDTAIINITNTGAAGTGFGSLRASDSVPIHQRQPAGQYSSVNFAANAPANPNLAFTTIGPDNETCYDGAMSDHDVILDLAATIPSDAINAFDPVRILDTRQNRPVAAGSSICVEVPNGSPGDTAVINITNTGVAGTGFGALRASDSTPVFERRPASQFSSVNFAANTPANPNLAFATVGPDKRLCYDGVGADADVILDLAATLPPSSVASSNPRRVLDTRTEFGSNILVPTFCGEDLEGRPSAFALNCSGSQSLENIRWSTWGLERAEASGRFFNRFSGCAPDCGDPDEGPVEIVLTDLRRLRCGDAEPDLVYHEVRFRPVGSDDRFEV